MEAKSGHEQRSLSVSGDALDHLTEQLGGRQFDYRIFEELCEGLLDAQQDLKYLRKQIAFEAGDRVDGTIRRIQGEVREKLHLLRSENRDKVADMRVLLRKDMMMTLYERNKENEDKIENVRKQKLSELEQKEKTDSNKIKELMKKINEHDETITSLYQQSLAYSEYIRSLQSDLMAIEKTMKEALSMQRNRERDLEDSIYQLKQQIEKRDGVIAELRKTKSSIDEENSARVDRSEFQQLKEDYVPKIESAADVNNELRQMIEDRIKMLSELEAETKESPPGSPSTSQKAVLRRTK